MSVQQAPTVGRVTRDVLFEVCDALARRPERVHMLAELCLEPECRRGTKASTTR